MYENYTCELTSDLSDELALPCATDDEVVAEKYAEAMANMMSDYTGVQWSVVRIS